MFNSDFNPYDDLEEVKRQTEIADRKTGQLAQNLSQQATLAQQMVSHLNHLSEIVNELSQQMEDLHNRIRLLEIARQYDDQYKNQN